MIRGICQEKRNVYHSQVRQESREKILNKRRQALIEGQLLSNLINSLNEKNTIELPSIMEEAYNLMKILKQKHRSYQEFIEITQIKTLLGKIELSIHMNGFDNQPSILKLVETIFFELCAEDVRDAWMIMNQFTRLLLKYSEKENPMKSLEILNLILMVIEDMEGDDIYDLLVVEQITKYLDQLSVKELEQEQILRMFSLMSNQIFLESDTLNCVTKFLDCVLSRLEGEIKNNRSKHLVKEALMFWMDILRGLEEMYPELYLPRKQITDINIINSKMNRLIILLLQQGKFKSSRSTLLIRFFNQQNKMILRSMDEILYGFSNENSIACSLNEILPNNFTRLEDAINFTLILMGKVPGGQKHETIRKHLRDNKADEKLAQILSTLPEKVSIRSNLVNLLKFME